MTMDTVLAPSPPGEADPAQQFEELLRALQHHRPDDDLEPVRKAYAYAVEQHGDQARASGDPYIAHPLAVGRILADLEVDVATITAGLLHDVVEDTPAKIEDITQRFGSEVAGLVDGLTNLKKVEAEPGDDAKEAARPPEESPAAATQADIAKRAANLRRILLAMAKDLRVVVIKLADRLHNMRTLQHMSPASQRRIARETLEIFAPLAHRVGIWQIKWELEDLAFKFSEPEAYEQVARRVAQTRGERVGEVQEAVRILKERLAQEGIPDAHITGRPKHLYSIYQKMLKQELDFTDIYDLVALRVLVHTRNECYHALGIISNLWTPMHGMYADYVARAKSNNYQSLHLKVLGPRDKPLEIQIRTWDMHRTAEFGVAAHWAYKEKGEGGRAEDQFERKLSFLRQQLFDWQDNPGDHREFLSAVIQQLFSDQVFVFTPQGDVLDLPSGATPIDFAYRIHSSVGNHAVGAKVNGRIVQLAYTLSNGDVVEIMTRSNSAPSRDWLALAKTGHARSKIKAYFKHLLRDEHIQAGREMLLREAVRQGVEERAIRDEALRPIALQMNLPDETELLAAIGMRNVAVGTVLNRLAPEPVHTPPTNLTTGKARSDVSRLAVSAGDIDNVAFRRANCCLPIPGDSVLGYVTRGKGITLHRRECANAVRYLEAEPERIQPVEYGAQGDTAAVFAVNLRIDTADRTGLLGDVGTIFAELKTNITASRTQSDLVGRVATMWITVEVRDVAHLAKLVTALNRLTDIFAVERLLSGSVRPR
jgi:GTP pyrophosphokinase